VGSALVFGAIPAAAEPVRISAGSLVLDITELPYAIFNLPQLGFQGLFGTPSRSDGPCRQPCAPGTLVDASLTVALRDGTTNRLLEGTFASGQIQVPASFGGGSSPFTFACFLPTATVTVFASACVLSDCNASVLRQLLNRRHCPDVDWTAPRREH